MSKTVQVFGQKLKNGQDCPYCVKAREHLERLSVPFVYRDIANGFDRKELLSRFPEAKSVPQIFIGNKHIGGHDDLVAIPLKELQQMIGG